MGTFDRVMDLIENDAVALFNYAVYAGNAGSEERAAEFFEKATVADPEFGLAFFQLGMSRWQTQDNEAAIVALERFLELEPDHAQAGAAMELIEQLRQ